MNVGNYDVLLERLPGNQLGFYSESTSHIGNNRFSVMLEMRRKQYEAADNKIEICDRIIAIVTSQCVPSGRFLVREGNTWQVLEDVQQSRTFVAQALLGYGTKEESCLPTIPAEHNMKSEPAGDHEDHKRQRSSSVLRISLESAKRFFKRTRLGSFSNHSSSRQGSLIFTKSKSSQHDHNTSERRVYAVRNPGLLDVIIDQNTGRLAPGAHVGNSRFRIFLDLHRGSYEVASRTEQSKIVETLVAIVKDKWKGRFLSVSRGKDFKVIEESRLRAVVQKILAINQTNEDDEDLALEPLVSSSSVEPLKDKASGDPTVSKDEALAKILKLAEVTDVDTVGRQNPGQKSKIMARFKSVMGPRKGARSNKSVKALPPNQRHHTTSVQTNSTSESTIPDAVFVSSATGCVDVSPAHVQQQRVESFPLECSSLKLLNVEDLPSLSLDGTDPDLFLSEHF